MRNVVPDVAIPEDVRSWVASHDTLIRQCVFATIFALSQLLWFVPGGTSSTSPPWTHAVPAVLVLVATVLSVVLERSGDLGRVGSVIPLLDLVAAGVLRVLTGGSQSNFNVLIILAVVLVGVELQRWVTVAAAPILLVVYLLPWLADPAPTTSGQVFRTFVTPVALWIVAFCLNLMVSQLRWRLTEVERLRQQQATFVEINREQAEELNSVIDAITEQSIIMTDLDGRIVLFNRGAEKLLRCEAGDVVGRQYITDFHLRSELLAVVGEPAVSSADGVTDSRDHRAAGPGHLETLVAEARLGNPSQDEWRSLRADGTIVPTFVSVTPCHGPDGQPTGFLFVATDLAWARQHSALKNAFVTLVSHEFRTPLSSILGYLELLADDLDPVTPAQANYLAVVERNANRLLQLVSDLLFAAQVETGRYEPSHTPVNLAALVLDSVRAAVDGAATRGITVTLDEAQPSIVTGDRVRLAQAVDNLLGNAVKFTRPAGQVVVTMTTDRAAAEPLVHLAVTDTGVGIPADELDLLFTRFFRSSTATRDEVPGVGMGLTITKAIAAAHDGFLSVTSRVGHGSTFTLTLPLQLPLPPRLPDRQDPGTPADSPVALVG